MTAHVLFHAHCPDGMGAAWAAWYSGFDALATYTPAMYDGVRDPEQYRGCDVYMVDFSWPQDDLKALCAIARSVTVIDHHKSAVENLEPMLSLPAAERQNLTLVLDQSHSGAWLSWRYFNHVTPTPPLLIQYIEDRDLWRWKMEHSREVSAWLRTFPFTLEDYQNAFLSIAAFGLDDVVRTGAIILRQQRATAAALADTAFPRQFRLGDGRVAIGPVANVPQATGLQSEVCEELLRRCPTAPLAACWSDSSSDKRQWSLRSRPTPDGECLDCSALARRNGGGGHKQAAGYTEHRITNPLE